MDDIIGMKSEETPLSSRLWSGYIVDAILVHLKRFIASPAGLVFGCLAWCVFSILAFPIQWSAPLVGAIILAHLASQALLAPRFAPSFGGQKNDARAADRMSFVTFIVPLAFIPAYLFGGRPAPVYSLVLLVAGLGATLAAKALIFGVRGRDVLDRLDRRAGVICGISVVVITLTMTGLMIVKYYTLNYYGQVLAAISQALWGTANGDFSMSSLWDFQYIYSHGSYILLGLVPFYSAWPSPLVYMIIKCIFIGLAAIPLFKIARLYLRPSLALLIVLLFMLYPGILSQHVIEENRSFAPFFVLFMLYFLLKGRWGWFITFFCLSLSVKLSLMPALILVPLYALYRCFRGVRGDEARRSVLKWAVVPAIILVAYLAVSFLWLVPKGQQGDNYYFNKRYSEFGSTGPEIVGNMLRSPARVVEILTMRDKLVYYYLLLLPFGLVLIFRSVEWIMAVPILLVNLLQNLYMHPVINDQYTAEAAPFLVVAFVISLYRFTRKKKERASAPAPSPAAWAAVALVVLVALTAGTVQYWLNPADYASKPYASSQWQALRLVPTGANVQASWYFLPELSSRSGLYMHNITADNDRNWLQNDKVDYFILDTNYNALTHNQQIIGPVVLEKLEGDPQRYQRIFCRDGIYVFHRKSVQTAGPPASH
jgi:uncharacterized membrane protein